MVNSFKLTLLMLCLLIGGCNYQKHEKLRPLVTQYSGEVKQHNLAAMRDFSESDEAVYNAIIIEIASPEKYEGRQITLYYHMAEEGNYSIRKVGTSFRFNTSVDLFVDNQQLFLGALEDIEIIDSQKIRGQEGTLDKLNP